MILDIVSPTRRVLAGEKVSSVTVPAVAGEMTVLPGHADIVAGLQTGVLRYVSDSGKIGVAAVSTGVIEIRQDRILVLAETLEMGHEIDLERARRAQSKAEQRLREKDATGDTFQKHQLKLQRALIRQTVASENLK